VVPRWTYTRMKLETADRAKENLKPTAFSSTRSRVLGNLKFKWTSSAFPRHWVTG
jgi:hypothetical protein